MIKKVIAFSFIAWAFASISSPRSAKAYVAIPQLEDVNSAEITEVIPTGKPFKNLDGDFMLHCESGYEFFFYYQQLMAIPKAGTVWIITDTVYNNTGFHTAALLDTCLDDNNNTYYLYGLGSCEC